MRIGVGPPLAPIVIVVAAILLRPTIPIALKASTIPISSVSSSIIVSIRTAAILPSVPPVTVVVYSGRMTGVRVVLCFAGGFFLFQELGASLSFFLNLLVDFLLGNFAIFFQLESIFQE